MNGPTWSEALDAIRLGAAADSLEHQQLEFKQQAPSLREMLATLAEATVCFANADGGVIVVGVTDRPRDGRSIVGVSPDLTVEMVRRGIYDRTTPQVLVLAERVVVDEVEAIVITVPSGLVPCSTTAGTATRRIDRECRPFTPDQQRDWLSSRGLNDWSAELTGIDTDKADPAQVARLRAQLERVGKRELAALTDGRLLEALRLADSGRLRRAGLLLVGRHDQIRTEAPTYGYCYQYRDTPGQESLFRIRQEQPMLVAIDTVLTAIEARSNRRPMNLSGGLQIALEDLPLSAAREIVVNAFIHRNFETNGTVDVDHSTDGLSVVSPGGLVTGVTPDNILTHPSTPRNRLLTETVTTLGIAERTGQGIDRAFRDLLSVGKPPVDFEDRGTTVRAFITGERGNDAFARFVHSQPTGPITDVDVLLLLHELCRKATITPTRAASLIQRSQGEASRVLERMTDEPPRYVQRTRRGGYQLTIDALGQLGRAVRYRSPGIGDYDRRVADHLAEYDTISNRTLQRMFGLDVFAARDLLKDLQRRHIIVKLSAATSGRNVVYGAGPATKLERR